MKTTNSILEVTFTGIHARGVNEGLPFTGTGYMELADGKEYIYAKWHDRDEMHFQMIVPGSMSMRFEEYVGL